MEHVAYTFHTRMQNELIFTKKNNTFLAVQTSKYLVFVLYSVKFKSLNFRFTQHSNIFEIGVVLVHAHLKEKKNFYYFFFHFHLSTRKMQCKHSLCLKYMFVSVYHIHISLHPYTLPNFSFFFLK